MPADAPAPTPMVTLPRDVGPEQVKYMVDRFLGWKLPENFSPEAGIRFNPASATRHGPVGTNLFDATQAEAMVRYMLNGMPPGVWTSENFWASRDGATVRDGAREVRARLDRAESEEKRLVAALKTAEAERDEARRYWKADLELAKTEQAAARERVAVLESDIAVARKRAGDAEFSFRLYRTAWIREIGGKVLPKTHDIDALVKTTAHLRELAEAAAPGFFWGEPWPAEKHCATVEQIKVAMRAADSAGRPATEQTQHETEEGASPGCRWGNPPERDLTARTPGRESTQEGEHKTQASVHANPSPSHGAPASPATASPPPRCACGHVEELHGESGCRSREEGQAGMFHGFCGCADFEGRAATPEEPPPLRAELKCWFPGCGRPHERLFDDEEAGRIAVCAHHFDALTKEATRNAPSPVIADTAAPPPENRPSFFYDGAREALRLVEALSFGCSCLLSKRCVGCVEGDGRDAAVALARKKLGLAEEGGKTK